jgi:mono/diheme cytochrome c family protein
MKQHNASLGRTRRWKCTLLLLAFVLPLAAALERAGAQPANASAPPAQLASLLNQHCRQCHDKDTQSGGLDLTALLFDLKDRAIREQWIRIHDRVEKGEMPPKSVPFPAAQRAEFLKLLNAQLYAADLAEIKAAGRGPLRRLNRDEYEQNLRDLLQLPHLDIRDLLPADREAHHFNKVSETLDMSRVQLMAYLDAAETALQQALVKEAQPPALLHYRAIGKQLSFVRAITGEKQSMFFARNSVGIDSYEKGEEADPAVEMAMFRSPGWPYAIFPKKLVTTVAGAYRVRFSARAVLQTAGFVLKPATQPVPFTFRSRRPTNHDIAEDVKSVGGILDIQPNAQPGVNVYETIVQLGAGQTVEYGLLGLPVPQPDAQGITGSYRFPPFPPGGQPGIAFQWLEVEGPLPPASWPPASHLVLFDDLGVEVKSANPPQDATRLLRRFINLAAREPVPEEALAKFEKLTLSRLNAGVPLREALLAGYKAFLCSDLFLYLREPVRAADQFAIANRLAHFLTDTRPDAPLTELARQGKLSNAAVLRRETERLIAGAGFERFVRHFTDYWLSLRDLRRDDPDIRLYPEYRLDDYLVESMGLETRAFFTALVRENLPATTLVDANFTFANDRLARHYNLPPLTGSAVRKVSLPKDSPYGGLLTQAAILKITAHGVATSPVLRGAWVMDHLIGQPPPAPPPGVPAVEPDIRGAKSMRELLALHTKSASCAACHAKFDPVGLALENFDVMGRWRTNYRGLETGERISGIDPSGHDFSYTVANPVDASGQLADGRSFQDIHALKAIFKADPRQLARNLLHQFTVYATGTPVRFADRRTIEAILDAGAKDGFRVRDLLHGLVQSDIFQGTKRLGQKTRALN